MRPKKLYHGTKPENMQSILRSGLKIQALTGTDSTYIYTALTKEEAKKWGTIIFEIKVIKTDNLRNFYNENPIWQILIMNNIPSKRLKVV
jgi:RNA:NAD 2'-phosphotransferase (TPT1/KptA family)